VVLLVSTKPLKPLLGDAYYGSARPAHLSKWQSISGEHFEMGLIGSLKIMLSGRKDVTTVRVFYKRICRVELEI
jgi:hypothetical protein